MSFCARPFAMIAGEWCRPIPGQATTRVAACVEPPYLHERFGRSGLNGALSNSDDRSPLASLMRHAMSLLRRPARRRTPTALKHRHFCLGARIRHAQHVSGTVERPDELVDARPPGMAFDSCPEQNFDCGHGCDRMDPLRDLAEPINSWDLGGMDEYERR